jgi:hypothetical protein
VIIRGRWLVVRRKPLTALKSVGQRLSNFPISRSVALVAVEKHRDFAVPMMRFAARSVQGKNWAVFDMIE